MRILYGIQGTGNGHLTRSLKVIAALEKRGHEVDVIVSAQWGNMPAAHAILKQFKGFTFHHNKDGSINNLKTFFGLDFIQFYKDTKFNLDPYDKLFVDFEPVVAWAAKRQGREVIGISNQYAFLSPKLPRPAKKDPGAEFVFRHFAPVTTPIGLYFDVYDDFIYKPIIRDEVINMSLTNKGHYTVYIPDVDAALLLASLNKVPDSRFEVFTNKVTTDTQQGNCTLRPTHAKTFMDSFASCAGIITRSGFQTTAEALYTGKKLLSIPQEGQYEQLCNAQALAQLSAHVGTLSDIRPYIEAPPATPQPWPDPVEDI